MSPSGAERRGPRPPAGAHELFGSALPTLERYVEWLAGEGIVRGLMGPRETPRLWERHVINCAALATLIPSDRHCSVIDVGSGAGLPGVVLAIVRPDLAMTLVDSTARRTQFLRDVVTDLDLDARIRVVTGRVEEPPIRRELGRVDLVTSRAVAPLGRLAGWCLPLLADGGTVLAIKGAEARAEVAAEATELRRRRARVVAVDAVDYGDQITTVVSLTRR